MSVNPKQKQQLENMWEGAKEAGGSGVPDGTYQFKIVSAAFDMSPKPCFKQKLEVVAGDDKIVGETIEVRDNLETAENMGWFKSKLARLGMQGVTFDDISEGTLAEQMKGKVFEGQAKTKGGFLNIYVNRLISDGDGEEAPARKKAADDDDEAPAKSKKKSSEPSFEEGEEVEWKSKDGDERDGEVVEVGGDAGEGFARVKRSDNDAIVRVELERLSKKGGKSEDDDDDNKKEDSEEQGFKLPKAEDVDDMSMKEVKAALGELELDAEEIKNPRGVLHAFCALGHDPDEKIDVSEVGPLSDALGVTVKKGSSFKEQLALLSKAVTKKIGA